MPVNELCTLTPDSADVWDDVRVEWHTMPARLPNPLN